MLRIIRLLPGRWMDGWMGVYMFSWLTVYPKRFWTSSCFHPENDPVDDETCQEPWDCFRGRWMDVVCTPTIVPYISGAFGPPVAFASLKPVFLRSGPVAQCLSYPSGHWAKIIVAGFLAPFPRLMFTVVAFLFFVGTSFLGVHFFRF